AGSSVAVMLRQVQPAFAAREAHVQRKVGFVPVLEIDREAKEINVELARLGDVEHAQHGRDGTEFHRSLLLECPKGPRRQPLKSRMISRAALCPGAPVTPPPGCAPDPHRYSPFTGVRYLAHPATGRIANI